MFMQLPLLNHQFAEKQDSKIDLIWFISLTNFEIVFILLAKSIVVDM